MKVFIIMTCVLLSLQLQALEDCADCISEIDKKRITKELADNYSTIISKLPNLETDEGRAFYLKNPKMTQSYYKCLLKISEVSRSISARATFKDSVVDPQCTTIVSKFDEFKTTYVKKEKKPEADKKDKSIKSKVLDWFN